MRVDALGESIRQIVERLADGILLVDRGGHCLYLNAEAERILNQKSSELVGKRLRETMPDTVGLVCEDALGRILGGEEVMLIRSFFARDRWYELLGRPLDSNENFLLHFRDITERLQAESARRHSEEQFRLLVNGVRDYALFWLDLKGQVASWNVGAERIYGYAADEILRKHVSVFFAPDEAERGVPRRTIEGAVKHGSVTVEGWRVRKDGSRFLVNATYSTMYDDRGEPTGFAIVTRNITERRRIEQQLRDNEERLRLAVEAGDVGPWEYNVATDRFVASDRFFDICGLPRDVQPTARDFAALIHPDDRERIRIAYEEAMSARGGCEFENEYRVINRADGQTHWVESHGRIFPASDGTGQVRALGVLRDTTKRHQFDEFRRLAAGLIAHDLRSPMAAIRMSSQMLIDREALPAAAAQTVKGTVRKIDQMARMVEQLLDYTRAQFDGGLPLHREPVDLAEVCRRAFGDAQAAHPDARIRFDVEGDCHGYWDRIRLTEVAANLVGNAIKHGERGQLISVLARDEGDRVSLSVHNVGTPIRPELLSTLFEPFRRGPRTQSSEPSFGLGLYIVREIVTAHGGTIEASSTSATGTTFTVWLPRGMAAYDAPHP